MPSLGTISPKTFQRVSLKRTHHELSLKGGLRKRHQKRQKCDEKKTPTPESIARRNERERNRVKQVNNGFSNLRQHVPTKLRMSKVETLRMAVKYIKYLSDLLNVDPSELPENISEVFDMDKQLMFPSNKNQPPTTPEKHQVSFNDSTASAYETEFSDTTSISPTSSNANTSPTSANDTCLQKCKGCFSAFPALCVCDDDNESVEGFNETFCDSNNNTFSSQQNQTIFPKQPMFENSNKFTLLQPYERMDGTHSIFGVNDNNLDFSKTSFYNSISAFHTNDPSADISRHDVFSNVTQPVRFLTRETPLIAKSMPFHQNRTSSVSSCFSSSSSLSSAADDGYASSGSPNDFSECNFKNEDIDVNLDSKLLESEYYLNNIDHFFSSIES